MDDNQIRLQLEAGLDEDLQIVARDAKVNEEVSLHLWIAKMKDLNNKHITQWKQVTEAVEAMQSNKKPFTASLHYVSTNNANTRTQGPQLAISSNSTHNYPPKLTKDECQLLMDHAGCYKCPKFYAGHRAHQCLTTISGKIYKTLNAHDAQCAKALHSSRAATESQPKTVATVSDANSSNQTDNFIAAVFPSISSNVVGDRCFLVNQTTALHL